eukprot:8065703-Ditylum_brightwellii.AAC.1
MDQLNMLIQGSNAKYRAAATEGAAVSSTKASIEQLPNLFNPLQPVISMFSRTDMTPSAQDSMKVSENNKNHMLLPLI